MIKDANDFAGPEVTSIVASPNPNDGAATFTLTALAADLEMHSNIVQAEWYVGADPGTGNGYELLPADGTFNAATEHLTSTISTSGWSHEPHVLWLRARDSAGNWGRSYPITVFINGGNAALILSDPFNGQLAAWTQQVGQLALDSAAQLDPTEQQPGNAPTADSFQGLRASVNGNTPAYLRHIMPPGEKSYKVSFHFHPNGIQLDGSHLTIFNGQGRGSQLFGVEMEQSSTQPGEYEVRAWVTDGAGKRLYIPGNDEWFDIGNQAHRFEIRWMSSWKYSFEFLVDGELVGQVKVPRAERLYEIRLGPSEGFAAQTSGSVLYDGFNSVRTFILYAPFITR